MAERLDSSLEAAKERIAELQKIDPVVGNADGSIPWHIYHADRQIEKYKDRALARRVPRVKKTHSAALQIMMDNDILTDNDLLARTPEEILSGENLFIRKKSNPTLGRQTLYDLRLILEAEQDSTSPDQ
jgi:hypothetical protein